MRLSANSFSIRREMSPGVAGCDGWSSGKNEGTKKGQVTYIAPLQPPTLAPFRTWGIQQELVV